jgi:hypothetical protein
MGETTDRKVAEIEQTRGRLESDLRELEKRLPSPLRSVKSLMGIAVGGTALSLFLLERLIGRRTKKAAPTEVVIRVVREEG